MQTSIRTHMLMPPAVQAARVLIVEDDASLGNLVAELLQDRGYRVSVAADGDLALAKLRRETFDLCVLDVGLPRRDGFQVAREIRLFNLEIPIIYLTGRTRIEDKSEGYAAGGDDYLTKPFSLEELVLRIQAVLRRAIPALWDSSQHENSTVSIGDFVFHYPSRTLTLGGRESTLTAREADLLRMLVLQLGSVVRRRDVLTQIWGNDNYFNARSMDVFISKLRKYLSDDPRVRLLNVHGVGYKLLVA